MPRRSNPSRGSAAEFSHNLSSRAETISQLRFADDTTLRTLFEGMNIKVTAHINNNMTPAEPSNEPDAGTLCDYIHILAQMDVALAFKNDKEVAPAAEMTLSGLQGSETEAFDALLDVYTMSYQRVVDGLDRAEPVELAVEPIKFDITHIRSLCVMFGAYQASKDIKDGIGMESTERMEDAGDEALKAVSEVASRAVGEYYFVCASHYLWKLEQAERVLFAEDIVRVEKLEDGVRVVMKNSAKHVVVDGDVSPAVYAKLLALVEEDVVIQEAAEDIVGDKSGGAGGGYPAVNAGTASENMYG